MRFHFQTDTPLYFLGLVITISHHNICSNISCPNSRRTRYCAKNAERSKAGKSYEQNCAVQSKASLSLETVLYLGFEHGRPGTSHEGLILSMDALVNIIINRHEVEILIPVYV